MPLHGFDKLALEAIKGAHWLTIGCVLLHFHLRVSGAWENNMKLTEVEASKITLLKPDEEGGEQSFIVRIGLIMKHGDEPIGLGINMAADVPYDPSLTFDEIAKRGVARAREILRLAVDTDEVVWSDLHKESLQPPKPFTYQPDE
jgi:hypothetical protein